MYQANVYSLRAGKLTTRNFDTWDIAAGNLAVLLRADEYPGSRDEIVSALRDGARVEHRRYAYWVSEAP